jgi:hypothetical protein
VEEWQQTVVLENEREIDVINLLTIILTLIRNKYFLFNDIKIKITNY